MSESILPTLPQLLYGGDYNPEQWPEEVWQEDATLMREAGVNLVTLGVFSWAKLEPRPGQYDFAWLDRVMDLLHQHGVKVNLATATASPPPWLAKHHPESLPVTTEGVTLWPGSRQHLCPSSAAYREAALRLVRRLAERYRDHPALALWHIGNEYGCHVYECFCEVSARAFRAWLRERYGTVAALNEAWGTAFWSQAYGDWEEVNPPRAAPTFKNPTQQLDWQRFSSDALLGLFEAERGILKELTPEVPVTTNFMGLFKPLDYWRWAERQDVISNDSYPDPGDPNAAVWTALEGDLMRSLGDGRPWILMEGAPSAVNWRAHNLPKRPGQMRFFGLQAVSRGADGVMFFQWRASRAGAEKFHSGMVPHAGTDTRVWREVRALGAALGRLGEVASARVRAEVAILLDWESWWALELNAHPSSEVRLRDLLGRFYAPLYARNVAVDFVKPGEDLSRYKLVLAPNLYLVREGVAEEVARFVEGGGVFVLSFFSGVVDERDHIYLGGYPAPFRRLLGLRTEEFAPLPPGEHALQTEDGETFGADLWSDALHLEGASAVARFGRGVLKGQPAVTRHALGAGSSYYLGTRLAADGMSWLLERALREAGVEERAELPAGVEVVRRETDDASFLFVLNGRNEPVTVPLGTGGHDLLEERPVGDPLELPPYGVAVLRLDEGVR